MRFKEARGAHNDWHQRFHSVFAVLKAVVEGGEILENRIFIPSRSLGRPFVIVALVAGRLSEDFEVAAHVVDVPPYASAMLIDTRH